eukprot:scaffold1833_cov255-Pinguiococcus_pyrenoidosus.AAC.21
MPSVSHRFNRCLSLPLPHLLNLVALLVLFAAKGKRDLIVLPLRLEVEFLQERRELLRHLASIVLVTEENVARGRRRVRKVRHEHPRQDRELPSAVSQVNHPLDLVLAISRESGVEAGKPLRLPHDEVRLVSSGREAQQLPQLVLLLRHPRGVVGRMLGGLASAENLKPGIILRELLPQAREVHGQRSLELLHALRRSPAVAPDGEGRHDQRGPLVLGQLDVAKEELLRGFVRAKAWDEVHVEVQHVRRRHLRRKNNHGGQEWILSRSSRLVPQLVDGELGAKIVLPGVDSHDLQTAWGAAPPELVRPLGSLATRRRVVLHRDAVERERELRASKRTLVAESPLQKGPKREETCGDVHEERWPLPSFQRVVQAMQAIQSGHGHQSDVFGSRRLGALLVAFSLLAKLALRHFVLLGLQGTGVVGRAEAAGRQRLRQDEQRQHPESQAHCGAIGELLFRSASAVTQRASARRGAQRRFAVAPSTDWVSFESRTLFVPRKAQGEGGQKRTPYRSFRLLTFHFASRSLIGGATSTVAPLYLFLPPRASQASAVAPASHVVA